MYMLLIFFIKFNYLFAASFLRYMKFNLICNTNNIESEKRKIKKFYSTEKEISEYYNSLDRMIALSGNVIKHIKNLRYACDHGFREYSLPCITEFIHFLNKSIKNARNKSVFEYELCKFCEFYYHTLFYIMKHNENFQNDFFLFSKQQIVPLFDTIIDGLQTSKCKVISESSFIKSLSIKRISNRERRNSLINFLIEFLENQNVGISIDQIDANYTIDDLIFLCMNIFSRFSLRNRSIAKKFHTNFRNQNYLISKQFMNNLFTNGRIAGLAFVGRLEIKRFLRETNFINLENYFLERRMIPPICDQINRLSLRFGLPFIDYPTE